MTRNNPFTRREALAFAGAAGLGGLLAATAAADEKKPAGPVAPEGTDELAFLRHLVDAVPAAFYVWSTEGKLLMANEQWEKETGLKRGDCLGKAAGDFFPAEAAKRFLEVNKQVIAKGGAVEADEFVDKAGGRRVYRTMKFPVRNKDGRIVAVGGISFEKKG